MSEHQAACVHHYILGPMLPETPLVGTCSKCGIERTYPKDIGDQLKYNRGVPLNRKTKVAPSAAG